MDIQRLRNLTTGKLHTKMEHIYEDIALITGFDFMTHELPAANRALRFYLVEEIQLPGLFDEVYDPTIKGEVAVKPMNENERALFKARFAERIQPLPADKTIVIGIGSWKQ